MSKLKFRVLIACFIFTTLFTITKAYQYYDDNYNGWKETTQCTALINGDASDHAFCLSLLTFKKIKKVKETIFGE